MNGGTQPIEHIVVLMFENRSFDHLFGAFREQTACWMKTVA